MKSLFLLLFLWTYSFSAQNTQLFRAVYQYHKIYNQKEKARHDSLIKNDAFYRSFQDFQKENIDNRTFILYFNDSISSFNQDFHFKDPQMTEFFYEKKKELYLYKNLHTQYYYQNKHILDISFTVTDTLPDFHWKITDETKKIGHYLVIKAKGNIRKTVKKNGKIKTLEQQVTAWFSPEIPISNGPELYGGLPGLIMEVSTENAIYLLKELEINPKKAITLKKPKIAQQKGSLKDYYLMMEKIAKDRQRRYKNRRGI